jgi:hypothetical protein
MFLIPIKITLIFIRIPSRLTTVMKLKSLQISMVGISRISQVSSKELTPDTFSISAIGTFYKS